MSDPRYRHRILKDGEIVLTADYKYPTTQIPINLAIALCMFKELIPTRQWTHTEEEVDLVDDEPSTFPPFPGAP